MGNVKKALLCTQKTLPRFFFSTFDKDQLAKIYRHCYKEHLKISKRAEFEGDMSETSEDVALQSRKVFQTFVWWGHKLASHHTKRL